MSLVFKGKKVQVEGLSSSSFLDDTKLKFTDSKDYRARKTDWVRNICVHTRMGISPQKLIEGSRDRNWDERGVKYASNDSRTASWHISVDADGSFVCHLDLVTLAAYHCGQCNEVSIGIEMYQDSNGAITTATLDATVKILDTITRELKIQRQFPSEDKICTRFASNRKSGGLAYLENGRSGTDWVGVFGHRNATSNRGKGDPGDYIFDRLRDAGYEEFSAENFEDIAAWKIRQERLGIEVVDGIPGPSTVKVIEADNQAHGIWIPRPGDDEVLVCSDE